MNQNLDKINGLVTSLKMQQNEITKLKETKTKIAEEKSEFQQQIKKATQDIEDGQKKFDEDKKQHEETVQNNKEEIEKLKDQVKDKNEERELFYELKELQQKIEALKKENEFLVDEIKVADTGKVTPGYSMFNNPKLSEEDSAKMLENFAKNIQITKSQDDILSMATMKRIFDATVLYHSKDFVHQTYVDRIERRKHMNDDEKYLDIVLKQMNRFDDIVDAAQLKILKELGLTLAGFSSSIEFHFTHGDRDIYALTTAIPQKLKTFIPIRKYMPYENIKEVITFQKDILDEELKLIDILEKTVDKDNITPDRVGTLMSNRLLDRVAEKFDIEEEDFMKGVTYQDCQNDMELNKMLIEIKNKITRRLPSYA